MHVSLETAFMAVPLVIASTHTCCTLLRHLLCVLCAHMSCMDGCTVWQLGLHAHMHFEKGCTPGHRLAPHTCYILFTDQQHALQ